MLREFDMELLRKMRDIYFKSSKSGKTGLLDEYCSLTGAVRPAALKRFSRYRFDIPDSVKKAKKRHRKKMSRYNPACVEIIRLAWSLLDMICAERLHAEIGVCIKQLEQEGRLRSYGKSDIDKVLNISPASLKRIIAVFPKASLKKHKGNAAIYKEIPVMADFGKFARVKPGYEEVDYVEHNGGNSSGTFAITGNYTDVYSQWGARAAALGKNLQSIEEIDRLVHDKIYFPVLHYHPDNDKSILSLLFNRLKGDKKLSYDLSRSRPYHKNDNAHVEQKNGDKVRRLVGYFRHDSVEEVRLLNEIYDKADLIDNFFIPCFKLKEKILDSCGRPVRKIYEKPATPYQRVLGAPETDEGIKRELRLIYNSLNLVKLREELNALLDELTTVTVKKSGKFSRTKVMS